MTFFGACPSGRLVARSVVEDIPQQAEPLGALAGVSLQHFLAVKRGAVYIRSKHQFHCSSPYRFSFMSAGVEIVLDVLLFQQFPWDIVVVFSGYLAVVRNIEAVLICAVPLYLGEGGFQFLKAAVGLDLYADGNVPVQPHISAESAPAKLVHQRGARPRPQEWEHSVQRRCDFKRPPSVKRYASARQTVF